MHHSNRGLEDHTNLCVIYKIIHFDCSNTQRDRRGKKVERRYLEALLLKGYERVKAIPEPESLVVRGLKLESAYNKFWHCV